MKLWVKSLIALGVTGAVAGGSLGVLYAYSKTDASKGHSHTSARGLDNNLVDFKNFDPSTAYFVTATNDTDKIASYDYATDTVNGKPAPEWVNEQLENGIVPVLKVEAGPVLFENFYSDAIYPKEYLKFVDWFTEFVSWGPDISSLSTFRIKRGIQMGPNGRTVIMGNYVAQAQTRKIIQFIPDSFFGPVSLEKYTIEYANATYSKSELQDFIKIVNANNAKLPKNERIKIFSIEKRGYDQYYPVFASADDLLFDIEKANPIDRVVVSDDLDVETDLETGQTKLVERPGKHLRPSSQSTNLSVYKGLAGDQWEGLNFNWLKYVTQHEYGHMQTLGAVSTAANEPISVKPSQNAMPNHNTPGALFDMEELNRYLAARVPALRAVRAKATLTRATYDDQGNIIEGSQYDFYDDHVANGEDVDPRDFTVIAWEINPNFVDDKSVWTREKIEEIFGNVADGRNPNSAPQTLDVAEFLDNFFEGKPVRFFTSQLTSQRALAEALDVPLYVTYIMDAFDQLTSTTNAGFQAGEDEEDENYNNQVGTVQFLDSSAQTDRDRTWLNRIDSLLNMRAWNGVNLFTEVTPDPNDPNLLVDLDYMKEWLKGAFLSANQFKNANNVFEQSNGNYPYEIDQLPQQLQTYFAGIDTTGNASGKPEMPEFVDGLVAADFSTMTDEQIKDYANEFIVAEIQTNGFIHSLDDIPANQNPWKDDAGNPIYPTAEEALAFLKNSMRGYSYTIYIPDNSSGTNSFAPNIDSLQQFRMNHPERLTSFDYYLMTQDEIDSFIDAIPSYDDSVAAEFDKIVSDGSMQNAPEIGDIKPDSSDFVFDGRFISINHQAQDRNGHTIWDNDELKAILKQWIYDTFAIGSSGSVSGVESFNRNMNLDSIPNIGRVLEQIAANPNAPAGEEVEELMDQVRTDTSSINKWASNPRLNEPSGLSSVFSDYTYQFSEVLTRDWVQMTYLQSQYDDGDGAFRYQSDIAPVDEMNTGIDRYFDPSIFVRGTELERYFDEDEHTDANGVSLGTNVFARRYNFISSLLNSDDLKAMPGYENVIIDKAYESSGRQKVIELTSFWLLIQGINPKHVDGIDTAQNVLMWTNMTNASYLGGEKHRVGTLDLESARDTLYTPSITSNGWNTDRWLRSSLADASSTATARENEGTVDSWVLYGNDGEPIVDDLRVIDFTTGAPAINRVRAYWSFFMESRGVGSRTLAKLWRVPERDAFAMWGFFRNEWADVVKNLTFTNRETGEVKNFAVTTDVDNFFYYEHQSDASSRHTLRQDGYTSWTVDYLSMGTWYDSNVPNGEWTVTFTDENGNTLMQNPDGSRATTGGTSLFNIGEKEHITENGYDPTFAPVDFMTDENGETYVTIRDQFPI